MTSRPPTRPSQQYRIEVSDTGQARELAKEMLGYELRVSESPNVIAGAFKTGAHDDLVTALGLAVLRDPYQRAGLGPRIW